MFDKLFSFLKRNPIIRTLLLMVLVSVVAIILAFVLINIYARKGSEFPLPDLVGQNIDGIRNADTLDVVFVVLDSVFDPNSEGGTVRTQDPKPGTMVKHGRKIYVSISAYSADMTALPDIRDLSVRQAVSQLYGAGLVPGSLKFVESSYRNVVISASLDGRTLHPGQEVHRGSFIDLTVGSGNGSAFATVPFVLGRTAKDARRDILAASLNVAAEHFDQGSDPATAVVYKQVPEFTGAPCYPYGATVTLFLRNASDNEIDRMVKDFKVDSSQIISTSSDSVYDEQLSDDDDVWVY